MLLLMVSVLFIHANFTVSYAGGKNFLLRDGGKVRLKTGTTLKVTDTVVTGPKSFVAIRSDDGSVYKILANTSTRLDSYANDAVQRKANFTLGKGKIFSFVSKTFKKSDVKFLTSNGIVGIRGTSFLLDNSNDNLKVYLTEGSVAIYETDDVSTPVGVISAGQVAEKAAGEASVKVTPLTESQLEQATREIPTSVQDLSDSFGDSDSLDGEEEVLVDEEVTLASREADELRSFINDSLQEVDTAVQQNEQDIAERKAVRSKTIDGYKVTQHYSKEGNTINITSVSSKDDLMNTFSLALTYGNGFDANSFNASTPPSGLTSSILSIMGQDTAADETWGIIYKNLPDGKVYNIDTRFGNLTFDRETIHNGSVIDVDPLSVFYDDDPQAIYNHIFLTGMTVDYAGRYRVIIDYEVDLGDRVLDYNSRQDELFNHLYPNIEGVVPNRNVKVTLRGETGHLFGSPGGGDPTTVSRVTEAYYFTDGFGDYFTPLFDNPVTGGTP